MKNSPKQQSLSQESVDSSCKHPEGGNISGFAGQMVCAATAHLGPVAQLAGTEQASVAVFQ